MTPATKDAIRERVWSLLEEHGAVERPARGRIPAFVGAELAAERLADDPAWMAAGVVKAVPDRAQLPARARALADGKLLYMAVPRMATPRPFYALDPNEIQAPPIEAATSDVAARVAQTVDPAQMRPIDVIVCGSVAVNRQGARLGKGAGYSDLEFALLYEAGLISDATMVATTVHQLQVLADPIPEAAHDFPVDLIVTPDEIIRCPRRTRPTGIVWHELDRSAAEAIPALAARAPWR